MGCSAQDQIRGYKEVHKKITELNPKVDKIRLQFAINDYWLNLKDNIMNSHEKDVYKKLVEQTDGVISISHSDTKQTNTPLVFVKEIGNEYVVYLDNGQNYTFEKGKVKSKTTASGRSVLLPSMELTKYLTKEPEGELYSKGSTSKADTKYEEYAKIIEDTVKSISNIIVRKDDGLIVRELLEGVGSFIAGKFEEKKGIIRVADIPSKEKTNKIVIDYLEKLYMDEISDLDLSDEELIEYIKKDPKRNKYNEVQEAYSEAVQEKATEFHSKLNLNAAQLHEFIHAGAHVFMKNNPNAPETKRIEELYKKVQSTRYNHIFSKALGDEQYWRSNIDEFIAEALSNPEFMVALNSIPVKEMDRLSTVFKELVDTLMKILGFKNEDTVYKYLLDGFMAIVESQQRITEEERSMVHPRNSKDAINLKEELDRVLGSKEEPKKKINWNDFERVEKTVHKNVESMQKLLEELHVLGGKKESDSHLKYLKDLIGSLDQDFLTNMNVYITTKAKASAGMLDRSSMGLWISKAGKLAGNQQSEAEIYAHEVIHSYVRYAFDLANKGNIEARKIVRELEYVLNTARKNTKWQDLLPKESIDSKLEEKNAKEMYDYIFNSKHAEEEFISHVLTNPIVMEVVKNIQVKEKEKVTTLGARIKKLFQTIMDLLSGNYEFKDRDKNVYEATRDLTFRLAEYNNKAVVERRKNINVMEKVTQFINSTDEKAGEVLEDFINKHVPKDVAGKKPKEPLAKAKWMTQVLTNMIVNPVYRNQLSKLATVYGMPPEGTLQTIMRDFTDQDDLSKTVDFLALGSDRIDGFKMSLLGTMKQAVETGFKEKLTKAQKKSLTRVIMDTDFEILEKKYSTNDLRRLLKDKDYLETQIGRIKHKLEKNEGDKANYYKSQATSLGYYLATGKANIALGFNALNIARGLMTNDYKSPSKELVNDIDVLATLVALKYTDSSHKLEVEKLMRSESKTQLNKGVKNLIEIARNLKKEAKNSLFLDSSTHIVKGYTKEVFDDRITMEIDTIANEQEMKSRGFKLVKKLDKNPADTSPQEFGMYVSESFTTSDWLRTSARLTKMHSKGTSLKDLMYASEDQYAGIKHKIIKTNLDTERIKLIKKMMKGEFDVTKVDYGVAPVLDQDGAVVDYRYMMDKQSKEDYLGMGTDVADIVARTKAQIFDKTSTKQHNDKLLDIIKKDAEENYNDGLVTGKNDKQYILISPDSNDEKIKDLWNVLPKNFKEEAMNSEYKGLPVRRDLMSAYFGYRHLSVTDIPILKDITPAIIKNAVKLAETIWMEFIKMAKADVLIKMPFVLVGNIISNIVYAINTGTNPAEIGRMYLESTREVRTYLRKHRELVELQIAKDTGNIQKKDIGRIPSLERELRNSPIHELYELGIYQAIVEDVNKDEYTGTNRISKWYKDKTENMPQILKDGVNWMYLTEDTAYYKFMQEVMQMSDLIARDVENRKLKNITEQQINGKMKIPKWFTEKYPETKGRKLTKGEMNTFKQESDKKRLDTILNAFINYNKPSGSLEEYLNRVGLIMFTKYAKRIQLQIAKTGTKYPIKTLMVVLGQSLFIDFESIQDQSVLTRSWYNLGFGQGDLLPGKSLWEYIEHEFTPPIFRPTTYKLF